MSDIKRVVIGIQARSTSKRFPRKVFELIDGVPVLRHVINACRRSAVYMNRYSDATRIKVDVGLCIPKGDEIKDAFQQRDLIIAEGPEDDVLARYKALADQTDAHYIVRVTGDCPLLPPHIITKHVKIAVVNGYDYVSNVDEEARTAVDGTDCEVISRKLLNWLYDNAKGSDREHVTTLARRETPGWARCGHVVGYLALSHVKLSIDTPEDLERVRQEFKTMKRAIENAERKSGAKAVHRF